MTQLRVDIWSDIACPWCYIGKRHFEAALSQFPHRAHVEVRWRAFELDPSAPAVRDATVSQAERLAKKYGMSVAKAEAAMKNVTDVAAKAGLEFHLDKSRGGNTFDAHRVLHMALAEHDLRLADAVKERFLRAYMTEGVAIGDRAALTQVAGEAGLDPSRVRAMLESQVYGREVREDEEQAATLGITGVPFFLLGGKYAVSGAQPASVLLRALEQAWADAAMGTPSHAEGASCGPMGARNFVR